MFLVHPAKENKKDVKLFGAVQISDTAFLVYKNSDGRVMLKTGGDEKLQKKAVKNMLEKNPAVKRLLDKYRIRPSINTKTLKELAGGHMNETCNIAKGVYEILASSCEPEIDEATVKEASMLHDLGKILIPSKILNKPARLNKKEREIMNIHSTLGYELLKNQGVRKEILNLIKYHHQNLNKSGYPDFEEDLPQNLPLGMQIVSIADKYSALREARVYRRKLARIEALLILYKEVREGKIHNSVYKALVKYASIYDEEV